MEAVPWDEPLASFHYVNFERIEPEQNVSRYYWLGWQPSLFGDGAVVRIFGRKGHSQRVLYNASPSLKTAWPFLRALIRARLHHMYRIVFHVPGTFFL